MRVGGLRAGRMTLGACIMLALAVVAIGLGFMVLVPVSPPDAAMAARIDVWREQAAQRARS